MKAAPEPQPQKAEDCIREEGSVCVVDANVLISGIRVERLADQVATVSSVLEEVRDKRTR